MGGVVGCVFSLFPICPYSKSRKKAYCQKFSVAVARAAGWTVLLNPLIREHEVSDELLKFQQQDQIRLGLSDTDASSNLDPLIDLSSPFMLEKERELLQSGKFGKIILSKRFTAELIDSKNAHYCIAEAIFHRTFAQCLRNRTENRLLADQAEKKFQITRVEYVVNPELRQSFVLSKRTTPPKREIWGWHGSDAEGLMGILLGGFRSGGGDYGDVSVKHGRVYGKGIYFSQDPAFSIFFMDRHRKEKCIILSRVCVYDHTGFYHEANGYHRVVVAKKKEEALPLYVVYFEEIEKDVTICGEMCGFDCTAKNMTIAVLGAMVVALLIVVINLVAS